MCGGWAWRGVLQIKVFWVFLAMSQLGEVVVALVPVCSEDCDCLSSTQVVWDVGEVHMNARLLCLKMENLQWLEAKIKTQIWRCPTALDTHFSAQWERSHSTKATSLTASMVIYSFLLVILAHCAEVCVASCSLRALSYLFSFNLVNLMQ